MPHIIIEHSAGLDAQLLIASALESAIKSELFTGPDIQVRAVAYRASIPQQFVHVQAKIWHGRTIKQKQNLSQLIGVAIKTAIEITMPITVEVVDIDKMSYCKL